MKIIMFNSGTGSRLKPITNHIPKCLIKIDDKTILEHQILNLIKNNINEVIITTGPHEEILKKYLQKKFPEIKFKYIKNPLYENTNYIYSMWLTKKYLDSDIITLHGDLVFDECLLNRLIHTKSYSRVLVNNEIPPPKKDFKAMIRNGRIMKIDVNLTGEKSFFLAPMYKLLKKDVNLLMKQIDVFIQNKKYMVYAEEAFNLISDKIILKPLYYQKELCLEVDTIDDLILAKNLIKN